MGSEAGGRTVSSRPGSAHYTGGRCSWGTSSQTNESTGTETGNVLIVGPVFTRRTSDGTSSRSIVSLSSGLRGRAVRRDVHGVAAIDPDANDSQRRRHGTFWGDSIPDYWRRCSWRSSCFFAALSTAGAVSQEKDRKTLILLLLTRLNNSELVLGKLSGELVHVIDDAAGGLAGVRAGDVVWRNFVPASWCACTLVTLVTALAAGSLGSTLALWREKTFQTLALTALALVFWILICEAVAVGDWVPILPASTPRRGPTR